VKTITTAIKLALVALVANATWQLFGAYSPHFKFKDAVQYAAQYRGEATDEDLRQRILDSALQFEIPLAPADLSVTHQDKHTTVALSYTRAVDLAPGLTRAWPFTLNIDTYTIVPPKLGDLGIAK
jgi:hypothetical protein